MTVALDVVPIEHLHDHAARSIADAIRASIVEEGRCVLALSGGTTPRPMFRRLAAADVAWEAVEIVQVDERAAPAESEDRNLATIERELCARIDGKRPHVHPMPALDDDLDAAAERYAVELEGLCGRPPVLDVLHLGLGIDGHVASLLPDDPVLEVRDRWVAATRPYAGYRRLTLTVSVLEAARFPVLLVSGVEKAHTLAAVIAGDRSLPATRLIDGDLLVIADGSAASAISADR